MRQGSYTEWEKAAGAATAEECQKRGSENVGAIGNRVVAGSGSEAWKVLSPATADGTRVGGGRRGKGKGSGGSQ